MWQSPHSPAPAAKETSRRGHSGAEKGNLRASPGENGAASPRGVLHFATFFAKPAAGVSSTERCYEPFGYGFRRRDFQSAEAVITKS
jgi:hypothetical protein